MIEIIKLYYNKVYSQRKLAEIYNIKHATINDILQNRTWKSVERPQIDRSNITLGNQKLTENQVIEIIKLGKAGYCFKHISKQYNVTLGTITNIVNGCTWRHLDRSIIIDINNIINIDLPKKDIYSEGNRKLNTEKVIEIIKLYKTNKYSQKELAQMYNLKIGAIYNVLNNKTWKHIDRTKI